MIGVRLARLADVPAVAAAVARLLDELGGEQPRPDRLEAATRLLVERPDEGALLVAEHREEIVGVLAASWQHAIHVPGSYGLIQDLWVEPRRRGRSIGADLLAAFAALARERGAARIEVGLPGENFERIEATEAFYLGNGFASLGTRMRLVLS